MLISEQVDLCEIVPCTLLLLMVAILLIIMLIFNVMMMMMTMMVMMVVMMIISKVMDDNHEEERDLAEHHTPRPTCTSPISTPGQRNSSKMMEIVTSFELAWISSKTEVKMAMSRFNSITLPNNI